MAILKTVVGALLAVCIAASPLQDSGWRRLQLRRDFMHVSGFQRLQHAKTWQDPQYRKIGDRVYLRGIVGNRKQHVSAGMSFAALPAGFRPPRLVTFAGVAHAGTGTHTIGVYPGGTLYVIAALRGRGASHFIGIDSVSFSVGDNDWKDVSTGKGVSRFVPTVTGRKRKRVTPNHKPQSGQYRVEPGLDGSIVCLRGMVGSSNGHTNLHNNQLLAGVPNEARPKWKASFISVTAHERMGANTELHYMGVFPSARNGLNVDLIKTGGGATASLDTAWWTPANHESDAQWTDLPLARGFTRGPPDWPKPQYRRVEGEHGIVLLRGLISKARGTRVRSGQLLATLPHGARPSKHLTFAVATHGGAHVHRLDVLSNGRIIVARAARDNVGDTILDGVRFFRRNVADDRIQTSNDRHHLMARPGSSVGARESRSAGNHAAAVQQWKGYSSRDSAGGFSFEHMLLLGMVGGGIYYYVDKKQRKRNFRAFGGGASYGSSGAGGAASSADSTTHQGAQQTPL